jgi:hypothetical protein
MDPIQALNAIAPAADARLLDLTDGRYPRNFIGLLLADADFQGRKRESFVIKMEDSDDTQYKLRFDVDFPETQRAEWRNLVWNDTTVSPTQYEKPIEGRFDQSGFKGAHWIDEPTFNRLTKSANAFAIEANTIVEKIKASKHKLIQDDLFCYDSVAQGIGGTTRQGNPTPTWATWGANDTQLMHLAYALQSGYTGNAATGSGTYQYGENLDLNLAGSPDLTRIKAVSAGDTTTPFGVMDPTNIRTRLEPEFLKKDKAAQGSRKVAFADSAVRNYIMNYVEDKVYIVNPEQSAKFGYTDIMDYMGYWWVYEPYLDYLAAVTSATPYRYVPFIDPSTWIVRHHKLNETESINGAELKERQNVKWLWKWDFRIQVLCRQPWLNGMAFNVEVA